MTLTSALIAIPWAAIILVWFALLLQQRHVRRAGLILQPAPPRDQPQDDDTITLIVPTRNAASSLDACVSSLLTQDCPNLDILVVDDRSDDATPDRLREIGARHPGLRTCRIETLPEGWLGKSHALHVAASDASTRWLLFVDDDCMLEPHAVRTALLEARRRDVALLTLFPRHGGRSPGEHLVIPLCAGIIAMWFGDGRTGSPRRPMANGQFLLIRRDVYEAIGGHASVHTRLIEDIALAERIHAAGASILIASGVHLLSVRMYEGLRATMNGWARIFTGALRTGPRLLFSVAWLLLGSLAPFITLALIPFLPAGPLRATLLTCTITHLLIMMLVSLRFWSMGRCPRRYLLLYPLSVLLVMLILLRAWWWLSIRRHLTWRGVRYRIDRHACITPAR